MKKFKKGDKVAVSTSCRDWPGGLSGVIKAVEGGAAGDSLVRFNAIAAKTRGHGPGERDWYIENHFLSLVKPKTTPVETVVEPVKRKAPKGAQAYKGNGKHKWEDSAEGTQRLRVPGGWLYCVSFDTDNDAMTFVPVPTVVGYAV